MKPTGRLCVACRRTRLSLYNPQQVCATCVRAARQPLADLQQTEQYRLAAGEIARHIEAIAAHAQPHRTGDPPAGPRKPTRRGSCRRAALTMEWRVGHVPASLLLGVMSD